MAPGINWKPFLGDDYLFISVKDACKVPKQSEPVYVPLIWLPFTIPIPWYVQTHGDVSAMVISKLTPETEPDACPPPLMDVTHVPDTEEPD
jgi:hypothetical protein